MSASSDETLRTRARALAEDLNFSTLGWRIPSDRLIEDFAAQQHALRAREHELTDVGLNGERENPRRAFSLHALDDAEDNQPVGLLVEQPGSGWTLLLADRR
jgi:hypothetical protein